MVVVYPLITFRAALFEYATWEALVWEALIRHLRDIYSKLGFHFQYPPYEQAKIIHCIQGEILDVIIDIRKNTKNYGKIYSYHLSSKNPKALYIPGSFAHAFLCVSDDCLVTYNLNNEYSSKLESGISWNSVDFSWPLKKPIISDRDASFVDFKNFESPF